LLGGQTGAKSDPATAPDGQSTPSKTEPTTPPARRPRSLKEKPNFRRAKQKETFSRQRSSSLKTPRRSWQAKQVGRSRAPGPLQRLLNWKSASMPDPQNSRPRRRPLQSRKRSSAAYRGRSTHSTRG